MYLCNNSLQSPSVTVTHPFDNAPVCLKNRLFDFKTTIGHPNTGLVQFADGQCTYIFLSLYKIHQLNAQQTIWCSKAGKPPSRNKWLLYMHIRGINYN